MCVSLWVLPCADVCHGVVLHCVLYPIWVSMLASIAGVGKQWGRISLLCLTGFLCPSGSHILISFHTHSPLPPLTALIALFCDSKLLLAFFHIREQMSSSLPRVYTKFLLVLSLDWLLFSSTKRQNKRNQEGVGGNRQWVKVRTHAICQAHREPFFAKFKKLWSI